MVRSVDVGVAVRAAAIEVLDRVKRLWLRWVPAAVVARVADSRHPHLQQLRVAGTMRFVTVRAILHDGWVLPEEGTAAFGVTAQAVFIGGALDKLLRIGCAMRIVAARAGYLSFAIWHV
jgi:hypothetical protein